MSRRTPASSTSSTTESGATTRAARWTGRIALMAALLLSLLAVAQSALAGEPPAPRLPAGQEAPAGLPVQIAATPADGAQWQGEPVVFLFDGPVSGGTLTAIPPLDGELVFEGNEARFEPVEAPEPGVIYRLRLEWIAGAAGAETGSSELALQGAEPLRVAATTPTDGAAEVRTDSPIIVAFNRPVVALAGVADQAGLPQPLSFEPAVEGTGEWISTSVYRFTPAGGLGGSTGYAVTIAPTTAADGTMASEEMVLRFTTVAPQIIGFDPVTEQPVALDAALRLTFSQPMQRAAGEERFAMATTDGAAVAGAFAWEEGDTVLVFKPAERLLPATEYRVGIAAGALPVNGAPMSEPFEVTVRTWDLPSVTGSMPLDGEAGIFTSNEAVIYFGTPMVGESVAANIMVEGILTSTQVYSYFYGNVSEFRLNWVMEPQSTYTVTVGAAASDPFSNTLGSPYRFSFTTGDLSPDIRLDVGRFTHYTAYTRTLVGVDFRNVAQIDAELFRLPVNEYLMLSGPNQWQVWDAYQIPDRESNRIWQRSFQPEGEQNVLTRSAIALTDGDGNLLPPGIYMLEVQRPFAMTGQGDQQPVTRAVIVISNYSAVIKKALSGPSLLWLTDISSGAPVEGAPVRFYKEGVLLDDVLTGPNGIAVAELGIRAEDSYIDVMAVVSEPGASDFALVSTSMSEGIEPYQWNISAGQPSQTLSSFYTERPIYRPGQTVYWKGILRQLMGDAYEPPPAGTKVSINVNDAMGNQIFSEETAFSAMGTVDGEFALAGDAPGGFYYLQAIIDNGESDYYEGAGFQVASYRKPEFEVTISTDKPEYVQGDTVRVTAAAAYYSGGPLVNSPVEWSILASPFNFYWSDPEGQRWFSFNPFDETRVDYDPFANDFYGLVKQGTGMTDAEGNVTIELPADLGQSLQSQNWRVSVMVRSPNDQYVSAEQSFPVHRGSYYIGISPRSYVAKLGVATDIDLITIAPQGVFRPETALDVVVYEFNWNTVYAQEADGRYYWKSDVRRTPVFTTTVTTDGNGFSTFPFTAERGGQYQITATGNDENGNRISSADYLWASSDDYVSWRRTNDDRLDLVADKKIYAPGEEATLLIPNPFSGAVQALVTVERNGILAAEVMQLDASSTELQIPITADHIPNVYVSVVLVKGVDEGNPFPATKVGYLKLEVDTAEKELSIATEVSAEQVAPRDIVTYTLLVSDHAGNPVPNAEVSVAVVDKAIFALTGSIQDNRSLMDTFYYQRPLGVSTGVLLVINKDRISQQLAEGGKGGGGGGDGGEIFVREEFADTALWRANLVSDEQGRIQFALQLPDNLTTWVMSAKAVTADTKVGQATQEVIATQTLQVRPLLPRFFTAGDRAEIGAALVNSGQEALGDGLFMLEVSGASLGGEPSHAFTLEAGAATRFLNTLTVDGAAASVVFTMTATAGGESGAYADAVRLEVPVKVYTTREVVATSGSVSEGSQTEHIFVPATATADGELRVTVEPSLAAGMLGGLDYLEHYPYECNEQTVSRFLPNLFTVQALQSLAIDDPALSTRLDVQVSIGLQQLISRQNPDGGWGFWPGQASSPFISSYVLWGLAEAQKAGYAVAPSASERAIAYLDGQFEAPEGVGAGWRLNELAFMSYAMAEAGHNDPGRVSTLFDARAGMAHYGKAYLALALNRINMLNGSPNGVAEEDSRVQTLLDELFAAADVTATTASWHEESVDYWTMNTDVRSTAVVLAAFVALEPEQPLLPNVVRWLMNARQAGVWSTTQENAWSIIALTNWMEATGELYPDFDWQVSLNGQTLGDGAFTPENVTTPVTLRAAITELLRDEANLLIIGKDGGAGRLYYSTQLEYRLDAGTVTAQDRGLVIDRQFYVNGVPAATAQVGDLISVTVSIVTPRDAYHVLVEAPLPAGAEPIDPNLATSGAQYDEMGQLLLQPLRDGDFRWGWWTPSFTDFRDDKVAVFATYLPAGSYEYTFAARAAVAGEFKVLPAFGELMYFSDIWGRSDGGVFVIEAAPE